MVQVAPEGGSKISIYDLYSKKKKNNILIATGAVALLTAFSDTVYLPALKSVATSLHASDNNVALTVSGYMAAVAVGQVIWASVSDYYGRLVVMYSGMFFYEIMSIACVFADTIQTLIALRIIQGFVLGSTMVVASAIVADVFAPAERGTAMGTFLTPCLVGPVIAPVIGGALSEAYGWRATFVLLCVMTVPITVYALIILPETLHYLVTTKISSNNNKYHAVEQSNESNKNIELVATNTSTPVVKDVEECVDSVDQPAVTAVDALDEKPTEFIEYPDSESKVRPPMVMPWSCLAFLLDAQLAPVYFMNLNLFSAMFTSLTTLPLCLSVSPYNLSDSTVGFCFIPLGVAMLIGSIVGGIASDRAAARFSMAPEGRLVYAIPCMLMVPVGCIGFGFTIGRGVSLAGVLVTQSVLCFGQTALFPTVMGYVTAAKSNNAAGASGVATFVAFLGASVWVAISTLISDAIGVAYFYCILAGSTSIAVAWVIYNVVRKCNLLERSNVNINSDNGGGGNDVAVVEA